MSKAVFESDVTSDGTQTFLLASSFICMFESDVTSDGTQTFQWKVTARDMFESDVTSDGTQTDKDIVQSPSGLRVM